MDHKSLYLYNRVDIKDKVVNLSSNRVTLTYLLKSSIRVDVGLIKNSIVAEGNEAEVML